MALKKVPTILCRGQEQSHSDFNMCKAATIINGLKPMKRMELLQSSKNIQKKLWKKKKSSTGSSFLDECQDFRLLEEAI